MCSRWKKSVLAVFSLGVCLWLPDVEAGVASNVFVTVESASGIVENAGDGFSVEDSGEVRISPRRDWRLVSPQGGRAFVSPGRPAAWKVVSCLGEDSKTGTVHECSFPSTNIITHISAPELTVSSSPVGPFVYAKSSAGVDVAVGATAWQVANGIHLVETRWESCECGKAHDPSSETEEMPVNFGSYEWTTPSESQSGQSCTITLPNKSKGLHSVSVTCEPHDLPGEERVGVSDPYGFLFELRDGEYEKIENEVEYPTSEVGGRKFYLHGHGVSEELRDRVILASHGTSEAIDKSKFTELKVNLTATGLDGEVSDDEEESAGAFIHWNIDNDDDSDNTLGHPKHPGGDFLQTNATVVGENELQSLQLEVSPISAAKIITLKSAGISLWRFRGKGQRARILGSGETLRMDLSTTEGRSKWMDIGGTLYAEGVEKGRGSVEDMANFGECEMSDRVVYRIVAAECGNQPRSDCLPNGEDVGLGGSPKSTLQVEFPGLRDCEWSITGPQDLRYNCLAWSVGLTNVWVSDVLTNKQGGAYEEYLVNHGDFMVWMISIDGYYGNNDGIMTMDELDRFFKEVGNADPVDSHSEADILYYDEYHAAKRLECACGEGRWMMFESKCGSLHRIEHVYDQVSSAYGEPVRMYKTSSH